MIRKAEYLAIKRGHTTGALILMMQRVPIERALALIKQCETSLQRGKK